MPTQEPHNDLVEAEYPEPVHVPTPKKDAKPKFDTVSAPISEMPQRKIAEERASVEKVRSQVNSQSAPRNEDVQPSNTVIRPHDISHAQFLEQLIEQRNAPDPEPPPPPPVPPRIMNQTLAEMAAGRARVEHFEAQAASRPRAEPPSEKEGLMTPVHRPGDHVPKIV